MSRFSDSISIDFSLVICTFKYYQSFSWILRVPRSLSNFELLDYPKVFYVVFCEVCHLRFFFWMMVRNRGFFRNVFFIRRDNKKNRIRKIHSKPPLWITCRFCLPVVTGRDEIESDKIAWTFSTATWWRVVKNFFFNSFTPHQMVHGSSLINQLKFTQKWRMKQDPNTQHYNTYLACLQIRCKYKMFLV